MELGPSITLKLDGDNAWPDLKELPMGALVHLLGALVHLRDPDWEWAGLEGGMQSGLASVAIRINLPEDILKPHEPEVQVIILETSLRTLRAAVRALAARYPDPELDA